MLQGRIIRADCCALAKPRSLSQTPAAPFSPDVLIGVALLVAPFRARVRSWCVLMSHLRPPRPCPCPAMSRRRRLALFSLRLMLRRLLEHPSVPSWGREVLLGPRDGRHGSTGIRVVALNHPRENAHFRPNKARPPHTTATFLTYIRFLTRNTRW